MDLPPDPSHQTSQDPSPRLRSCFALAVSPSPFHCRKNPIRAPMGRSNTVECYKSNDPFEKALVLFRQSRTLLRYCGNNVELVFRSRSFVSTLSKSEISQNKNSFDTVAKTGNNVEAALDFVERIVQRVAFDTVVSTLLLVWTGHNATNQTYRRGAAKAA